MTSRFTLLTPYKHWGNPCRHTIYYTYIPEGMRREFVPESPIPKGRHIRYCTLLPTHRSLNVAWWTLLRWVSGLSWADSEYEYVLVPNHFAPKLECFVDACGFQLSPQFSQNLHFVPLLQLLRERRTEEVPKSATRPCLLLLSI